MGRDDRLAVYTVAVGADYQLPAVRPSAKVENICFTDQKNLSGHGWTLIPIDNLLPDDNVRSSREYKIRPHRWLREFSKSLYIDSSVELKLGAEDLWEYLVPNEQVVFGAISHSYRASLQDEFDAVRDFRLDFPMRINEQLEAYRNHFPDLLREVPIWGGVLARRHSEVACINAMEVWFANTLRYSRRDQLSLPVALTHLQDSAKNIAKEDIRNSIYHTWPHSTVKPKPKDYQIPAEKRKIDERIGLKRLVRRFIK